MDHKRFKKIIKEEEKTLSLGSISKAFKSEIT